VIPAFETSGPLSS